LRLLAGLLALASLGRAQAMPPLEASLRVFQPPCSQAEERDITQAVEGASGLLQARCGIRLALAGWEKPGLNSGWCGLPQESSPRSRTLKKLAARAKAGHPAELALFLLPSEADGRISWALVDDSLRSGCDSPQEARFLPRFGSLFFSDVTWMAGRPGPETLGPSRNALLLAHETLHALTHRGHPTHGPAGSVMADHVADLGPAIDDAWCACARLSPYLHPVKP
jgi:hypothetical protein